MQIKPGLFISGKINRKTKCCHEINEKKQQLAFLACWQLREKYPASCYHLPRC